MKDAERLADIATEIDGIKESFEDMELLGYIVECLHFIARKHNAEYED